MKELKFVDVGEGITEGHIQKWLVKDGDTVKEDQSIAQIETDKAVVNLPAPVSGIIKIVAKENSIVKVGDTICFVGAPDEVTGALPSQKAAPQPQNAAAQPQKTSTAPAPQQKAVQQPQNATAPAAAPQQKAAPQAKTKEIIATPSVRKLARDMNIDISTVTGTGPGGKILEGDLKGSAGKASKQGSPAKPSGNVERIPMSQTRKAIAKNMEESWKIPRATHMDLLDATGLWKLVGKEKEKMSEIKIHLTFLPFIIKALVQALKENPHFNASYDRDAQEIIVKNYFNIGLAAESEDGLKVIVIRDADKKSISQIAQDIQMLSQKIKDKTITLDEMKDHSITVTNIGSLGGGFLAVPMINPPDVAIIGILSIRDWVFVENGNAVVGKVLPFTITFDHRVVDGAEAVKLGNAIKKYLEDPEFLEMLG